MAAPSLRSLGTVVATTTASPSFAAPAGAVGTDVIVIAMFVDDGRNTVTAVPSGFTLAPDLRQVNDPTLGSPSHSLYVYGGRFSDVGAGPYGFTISASSFIEGRAAAIKDCITSGDPWEAADGATPGNTSVTTAPSVSAASTGADRYAIYFATNWTGGAWTPATGFTEQWDANDQIITIDDKALATRADRHSAGGLRWFQPFQRLGRHPPAGPRRGHLLAAQRPTAARGTVAGRPHPADRPGARAGQPAQPDPGDRPAPTDAGPAAAPREARPDRPAAVQPPQPVRRGRPAAAPARDQAAPRQAVHPALGRRVTAQQPGPRIPAAPPAAAARLGTPRPPGRTAGGYVPVGRGEAGPPGRPAHPPRSWRTTGAGAADTGQPGLDPRPSAGAGTAGGAAPRPGRTGPARSSPSSAAADRSAVGVGDRPGRHRGRQRSVGRRIRGRQRSVGRRIRIDSRLRRHPVEENRQCQIGRA